MAQVFHYPPELFSLLTDTIPRLCRAKGDVFFQGAGVEHDALRDLWDQIGAEPDSVSKYAIATTVLTRINEGGDGTLHQRREVVKRVTEFENFSRCWPDDQLKAKGLVAEISRVVNVKDSFTRMGQERDQERRSRLAAEEAKTQAEQRRLAEIASIKSEMFALFGRGDAQKRGTELEGVLSRLFEVSGIKIREPFALVGTEGRGIVEQIDGVVEIDSHTYLVEIKWVAKTLGKADISNHVVGVYSRGGQVRGIVISYSDYSNSAVDTCREAIAGGKVVVLCTLREIVDLLEQDGDFLDLVRTKVNAAVIDKNPWHTVSGRTGP